MLQLFADGLVIGSVISLGAIGLTMTFALLKFSNFGHGELMTWGAYAAFAALSLLLAAAGGGAMRPLGPFSFGWELIVAAALAVVFAALLAVFVDWLLFGRLRERRSGSIVVVMASFGAALALRNLLLFVFGPIPDYYTREIQIALRLVPRDVLGGLRITPDQLLVLGVTALTVIGLSLFLARTTLGRAMRAVAGNPDLARVAGIDVRHVIRWTWMIGGGLAALAGVLAGLTVQVRPTIGMDLLLPLFAAAILGGIGNVHGAVIGGLVVGLAESFATPLVGAEYRAAVAFVVIILLLLLRPTGLFGERT
jgi:branched-chain amino acid transport system permease protein